MFTLAICSLAITSAQAQKQLGGEHNVEVNFSPFSGSPIDGTTFKYRNFINDNAAIRVSLTVGSSSDSYAYWQAGEYTEENGLTAQDVVSPQLNLMSASSTLGIGAGYEIHFNGTDNLSPYFGFEGFFMMRSNSATVESWGANDLDNVSQPNVWTVWEVTNKQSYNSFGLNLLFGADYYFSDAIYIGFEAGLGFGMTKWGDHEIGTSDLTAFNIRYYGAFTPETAGQQVVDSHAGELYFDVTSGSQDTPFGGGGASFISGNFYPDYEGVTPPNHVSNTTIGNVFNGAIRVGFLFD